jgi:hypothetical protein
LIANCMSTYSAFAVRQRLFTDTPHKSFSFFAFEQTEQPEPESKIIHGYEHEEL